MSHDIVVTKMLQDVTGNNHFRHSIGTYRSYGSAQLQKNLLVVPKFEIHLIPLCLCVNTFLICLEVFDADARWSAVYWLIEAIHLE